MKRALPHYVKVIPYAADETPVIDRTGFLSAVFAVSVGTVIGDPSAIKLAVTLQDCDTEDGEFRDVADPYRFIEGAPATVEAGKLYNVDVDLLSCRRYIKISTSTTFEGGTDPAVRLSCGLALGDKSSMPV